MNIELAWCAAVAAIGSAQAQNASESQPLFRATTRVVEVSLQARRSIGSAAADMTAAQLRLFDNNREQAIRSFERVRSGPKREGQGTRMRRNSPTPTW